VEPERESSSEHKDVGNVNVWESQDLRLVITVKSARSTKEIWRNYEERRVVYAIYHGEMTLITLVDRQVGLEPAYSKPVERCMIADCARSI
jgi:hypothetical protein